MTTPAEFDEARLRHAAQTLGLDLVYRRSTSSTNADVLEHFARHQRAAVAVCETQSAGRGRRGRQWHSPPGGNIYCTLGVRRAVPAERQGLLSIVAGIALCRALQRVTGAGLRLKWPNDLLVEGRKLGGILIESRACDAGEYFFAVGFGLNLYLDDADHASIGRPAASLEQAAKLPFERDGLLVELLGEVQAALQRFDVDSGEELAAEFARYDAFHEREIDVLAGNERIRGINRGISADGQLRLETGQGLNLFSAAEISLDTGAACC